MDQQYWYYRLNEQQVGPVRKDDIHALLIQHILTADSYVWAEGMENWQQIGQIPDFTTLTQARQTSLRPTSVTVLATLNIVFGITAILFIIGGLFLPESDSEFKLPEAMESFSFFSSIVNILTSLVLLASGIGLLYLKNWARLASLVYGWFKIIWTVVMIIFIALMMQHFQGIEGNGPGEIPPAMSFVIGGMCATLCIGPIFLAYPIILIIFMRKPHVVQACSR